MKLILVVDDMAVFREPIAASLRLAGYPTACAADGEEALQIVRAQRPDLILLDVSMPKMDGITFLKHLRADPVSAKTAVILLTALTEKQHVVAAGKLGVRDYLLKSRFRLTELMERIQKFDTTPSAVGQATPVSAPATPAAAAAQTPVAQPMGASEDAGLSAIPVLMTREKFLERLEGALEGKTLSGVVAQVISLATSPRSDATQLASLISRDPMLSARVIQAANSAAYASAGKVAATIPDALRKMGFNAVRNIAAALGVFDCVPEAGADGFNPIRCWLHSFAVAQLCERICGSAAPEQAGLAYLVGLCHDLGEIFIRTSFDSELKQLHDTVTKTGRPVEELERHMFGITTSDMMREFFGHTGLPETIREPIEQFHFLQSPATQNKLVHILTLAENYANAAMLASSLNAKVEPFTKSFCRAAVGTYNPARPELHSLRSEVLSMTVTLARVSRADEAKLLAPLFKARKTRVWIARAPGVSEFDPVGIAIEALAQFHVHDRLPSGKEVEEADALLIITPGANVGGFTPADIERACAAAGASGRTLPVLAIACKAGVETPQNAPNPWRSSVALSELATFIESVSAPKAARKVA